MKLAYKYLYTFSVVPSIIIENLKAVQFWVGGGSTLVEHLQHHAKVKGLILAADTNGVLYFIEYNAHTSIVRNQISQ
jgi:hypothetical protein